MYLVLVFWSVLPVSLVPLFIVETIVIKLFLN